MSDYANEIKKAKIDRIANIVLTAVLLLLILMLLLLSIAFPITLIAEIPLICIEVKLIKKTKKLKQEIRNIEEKQIEIQRFLIENGYTKICDNFYLSEKEQKVFLLEKEYGFSQILDCQLSEDIYSQMNQLNSNTSFAIQSKICREININITVEDFECPNVKLTFPCFSSTVGKSYNIVKQSAEQTLSTLKIIISKNNEKYLEKGTVTKIEHKHITEKSTDELLSKLHELHKNGVLTDYEFAMKKAELLNKLK